MIREKTKRITAIESKKSVDDVLNNNCCFVMQELKRCQLILRHSIECVGGSMPNTVFFSFSIPK